MTDAAGTRCKNCGHAFQIGTMICPDCGGTEFVDISQVEAAVEQEIINLCEKEGFRQNVYTDHLGNPTFGHGLTWITEVESKRIIEGRAPYQLQILMQHLPWLDEDQPLEVAMVLWHMSYWMGLQGMLAWKNTLQHLEDKRYALAAKEMLDSQVWRDIQTRSRIEWLSERIRALSETAEEEIH